MIVTIVLTVSVGDGDVARNNYGEYQTCQGALNDGAGGSKQLF